MGEDEELVAVSSGNTPTPTGPDRVALPSPQPSGWNTPANIQALRASEVTNGAFSPSVLASGASSPVPDSASTATPRANPPARRPSRGAAAAAKLTGAAAFKRMFGLLNGANKPPPTPDSESETTSDRFRSNPPSRAQSFSSERPKPPSRPPSVSGDHHKFNLKDLLAAAPKPARKSSTGGSRKSDAGSEKARSVVSGGSGGRLDHYGICERVAIGKGATSIVKLAHKWDRTEEKLYAVKEFRKRRKNETEKEYVKKLTSEFCISSALHHINVVETVDLVKDENQHWCEVMEYCPGGDLYAAIKRGGMSPSEVECCFKQVLQGVDYLHSQGVAHRDIKPENLFFNQYGHLKVRSLFLFFLAHLTSALDRRLWRINRLSPPLGKEHTHSTFGHAVSSTTVSTFKNSPGESPKPPIRSSKPTSPHAPPSPLPSRLQLPSALSTPVAHHHLQPEPEGVQTPAQTHARPESQAENTDRGIMKDAWLATVEVCTDSKKPGHVHSFAQQRAQQVFDGRGA
ncbi:Pkinase protein [Rhizoctonia solani]|uniref:Pkinase protein n=1 Tax=Rhizoctonia solani TaxID=456999 RepID=A0A8H7M710_9AGAM|nr:Pkinase protein [Rhizoctonia solani]